MYLGYFPHFCIVYWIGAIPGSFWDNLGWTLDTESERNRVEKNSNHGAMDRQDSGTSINVNTNNTNDNTVRRRKGAADTDADAVKRPFQEGTTTTATTTTKMAGTGKHRVVSWFRVLDVTIHQLVPIFLFVVICIPYLIGGLPAIGPDGHVIVDLKEDNESSSAADTNSTSTADYTDIAVPGTPTTTTPTPTKKKNKKNLYAWQQQLAVFLKIDQ